jgi:hypothetical protein
MEIGTQTLTHAQMIRDHNLAGGYPEKVARLYGRINRRDETISELKEKLEILERQIANDKPVEKVIVVKAPKVGGRPTTTPEWKNIGGDYPADYSVCPCRVDMSKNQFKACGKKNNIGENQIYCKAHTKSFMKNGWFKNGCCLVKGEGMFGTDEQMESFGAANFSHKEKKSVEGGIGYGDFTDNRPPMIRDMYCVDQTGEYDWDTQTTKGGIEIPGNPGTSSDEEEIPISSDEEN